VGNGFHDLLLLDGVDSVAHCEDIGVVDQLQGRGDFDLVPLVESVSAERLCNEFSAGAGASGGDLKRELILVMNVEVNEHHAQRGRHQ
jgi:hypothetical protein